MELTVRFFIILTTVLCGALGIIVYHLRRLHLYRAAARFPGPSPVLPFLGNALEFAGKQEDILNKILKIMKKYPAPIRFWLGNRLFIAVSSAEHLKAVFLSPKTIEKEDLYKFVVPWMGTGLFTAPASKWRVHRKIISPTFNPRILESFVEVFAKQSKIMVQQMEVELDGKEFDIFNYVSPCTLDIVCESAMGINLKAQTEQSCRYIESASRAFEIIFERMFKIWLHPNVIFNRTRLGREQREVVEYLHSITNNVIKQKRIALAKAKAQPDPIAAKDERPLLRKAFLDLLIDLTNNGTKFTDEELREEVDTLMIAGNDTTATVNCFVILMLASHPEIQEKVYEELCRIYGQDEDRDVVNEDLNEMVYMERVIKESMRLFPVGPVLVRAVTEDLEIGEHTFPKGSSIIIGIMEAHRNPEYWPNPLKFDPDRFLPEETAKRDPYCYVPFSAGPRNCIGLRYAMMSMKALLATVLRKYIVKKDIITPIEDIELKADVMLKPMEPIKIRIERRRPMTDS